MLTIHPAELDSPIPNRCLHPPGNDLEPAIGLERPKQVCQCIRHLAERHRIVDQVSQPPLAATAMQDPCSTAWSDQVGFPKAVFLHHPSDDFFGDSKDAYTTPAGLSVDCGGNGIGHHPGHNGLFWKQCVQILRVSQNLGDRPAGGRSLLQFHDMKDTDPVLEQEVNPSRGQPHLLGCVGPILSEEVSVSMADHDFEAAFEHGVQA